MSCHLRVGDLEFSPEEIERTVRDKRLLSIEVEVSPRCNFDCRYCDLRGEGGSTAQLSAELGRSLIAQARELGARKLIVRGGEPMLYPHILEMLRHGREQELQVEVFTNGTGIERDTADRLFDLGVRVVLKRSSLRPEVQDDLAGRSGAHELIETAYRNLRAAGYPSDERLLGISSVVCRENASEIPRLWEWIREEGLVPYIAAHSLVAATASPDRLTLAPQEYQALFEQLAAWDREHGGPEWDPQPPLGGARCLRQQFSCLVDAEANVLPCVGVRIPVGNLRERSLREILNDSEVIENLREFRRTISGPCASCARGESCYGCRGAAYAATGDYLASDASCWHNRDRQHEIARMPVPAAPLVPHADPMRLVDLLLSVGERRATAGVTVRAEMPFVDETGVLSEAAFLEMIAQAAAAMGGFGRRGRGRGREAGLMLGTRNLEILGAARVGDALEIEVFKSARLGGFGIVEGCVRRQADVLARGEIKVLQFGSGEAS